VQKVARKMIRYSILILTVVTLFGCTSEVEPTSKEIVEITTYEEEITYPIGTIFSPPEFNLAFQEGFSIKIDSETIYQFQKVLAGKLSLPSGKLVITEPLVFYDQEAIEVDLVPGIYPVYISEALITNQGEVVDKRNALSKIVLNPNAKAVEWEFVASFPVDGGTGGYIDFNVMSEIISNGKNEELSDLLLEKFKIIYDNIKEPFNKHHHLYSPHVDLAFKAGNLISFSTGWGDGGYNSLIGYDETGSIVEIVTDLGIIEWDNEKYLTSKGTG
jgi:hypothetical protein